MQRWGGLSLKFRCYAYGSGENWEAFCVDLDIAIFGASVNEVEETLDRCIRMYLKTVADLSPEAATNLDATVPLVCEVQAGAHDWAVRLPGRQWQTS